jgi:hypothetical protein
MSKLLGDLTFSQFLKATYLLWINLLKNFLLEGLLNFLVMNDYPKDY